MMIWVVLFVIVRRRPRWTRTDTLCPYTTRCRSYRVEGPVMLSLTTTAIDIDEELMNRCLVLTVDESREQTRAIHALQRRRQTLEGLLAGEDRAVTLALHRNAQTLLEGVKVEIGRAHV